MTGKHSHLALLALSQQDFLLSPSSHQVTDHASPWECCMTEGAVILPGEKSHASFGRNLALQEKLALPFAQLSTPGSRKS